MAAKLAFQYDREADILHISNRPPYAEQETEELGDDVIARVNPKTGDVESLEVLSSPRGCCGATCSSCPSPQISAGPSSSASQVRPCLRKPEGSRGRLLSLPEATPSETTQQPQRVANGPGHGLRREPEQNSAGRLEIRIRDSCSSADA